MRLGRERFLKERQRLVEPPLLQVDLAELDLRAGVAGIDLQDPDESWRRFLDVVLRARGKPEHVMRLRRVRQPLRGVTRVGRRFRRAPGIQLGDRKIEPGESEIGMQLEGFTERLFRRLVVELFEARDAEIVRAVGALALRDRHGCSGSLIRSRQRPLQRQQTRTENEGHGVTHHLIRVVAVTPLPSTMVTMDRESAPPTFSVLPFGHTTSMPLTLARVPSPKVSGNSLCER